MIKPAKRATVYLDSDLHKILKFKATETSRSVSELVNEAVRHELLEDHADLEAFQARLKEPTVTYEQMLKDLKRNGKL